MKLKGKALRRVMEAKDLIRINGDVPLIVDTTELITPDMASEMLKHNTNNRPINWRKVEEYANIMISGAWKLHSQGIVFDEKGVLLTGQKRLWAVVYSGVSVYMRVSRGCPADTVRIMDRGEPQSARDIASRETERKHSPVEASIVRGIAILHGITAPSKDILADLIITNKDRLKIILNETKGTKKTKLLLMAMAAICEQSKSDNDVKNNIKSVEEIATDLERKLFPSDANRCWGRGVGFVLAMELARKCVDSYISNK